MATSVLSSSTVARTTTPFIIIIIVNVDDFPSLRSSLVASSSCLQALFGILNDGIKFDNG